MERPDSELAQFGRSKEKRKDRRLVVFSGVINSEGFIRHSRIYEGNNAGYSDTWMYVKSEAKRVKEKSMEDKLQARYLEDLTQIKNSIHKPRGIKVLEKVWERVGRIKEKYPSIAKHYEITVSEKEPEPNTKTNKKTKNKVIRYAADLTWEKKDSLINSDHGVYFVRTNYEDLNERELWKIYNTIREVESTFRCLKSDFNIRPIHHQLDHRIQSHIYLTMLAYQLVNTIR